MSPEEFDCSLILTHRKSCASKPFLGIRFKERRSRWNGVLNSDWRNSWRTRYSIPAYRKGCWTAWSDLFEPFAARLVSSEQRQHAREYVAGLFSDVKRKNSETIAYLHGQDRQAMQKFIGQSPWEYRPLIEELAQQIGKELGEPDGVLVFDPSAFKKQGRDSVGVARQWCGRLGKVDNCQVGVYLGYVSRKEHALVDVRLYLNQDWAKDKRRRKKVGVPREIRFRTRHALALEMLAEHGTVLPHAWIAGDDEMGRSSAFRRELRGLGEHYLLAVPSNTLVRDLDAQPPPYGGRGRHPQVPFACADRWCTALPKKAWTTVDVRDAARGPLTVQCVKTRVQAKTDRRRNGPEEVLVVLRETQEDGTIKHDYYLFERFGRDAAENVCRCGQGGASDRGVSGAGQRRCRPCPIPGSQLARLASPSNAFLVGGVVPDARRPAGEKNTPRRLLFRGFARSSPRYSIAPSTVALRPISSGTTLG